jgi:hypothetical protein
MVLPKSAYGDNPPEKKICRQISGICGVYYNTLKWSDPYRKIILRQIQLCFSNTAARKFSEGFSFQLTPTLVHYN